MERQWLQWARQLQSIAQIGIEYTKDAFDRERFEQIREISIAIMSSYTELDHHIVRQLFANETGYQTPKVDIRAAIFNDAGKILLVKEKIDNRWSLPGGWADIGLSIRENVLKEAKEEAGAEVLPKRLIAVQDRQKHIHDLFPYSIYKIFVECDFIRGEFIDNIETGAQGFFRFENLPELSTSRNTPEQIGMCFRARREKGFETFFD
jgi:ADP-ribose pyrophosphatase YjhB (NUDIX family)